MTIMCGDDLVLTAIETAELVGVSTTAILIWTKEGRFPPARPNLRGRSLKEVLAWRARRRAEEEEADRAFAERLRACRASNQMSEIRNPATAGQREDQRA